MPNETTRSSVWETAITVVQEVTPPFFPEGGHAMTIVVEFPPGDPGSPPHRHPGGPAFGYVIEGEMLFELEGEAPRVVRAGEAFWEPGGDIIHYSDGNNSEDLTLKFVVTMICAPGQPMLVLADEEDLLARKDRRIPAESKT